MDKQHTFCFKIEDVPIELLHCFLEKAAENHLFVDLPDFLQDGRNGSLEYDDPSLYVNREVDFTYSEALNHIGIDRNGFVVTYSKPQYFGENTVVIEYPHSTVLEIHLRKAATNKQQAPKGDEIVQLFQTADGRNFKTRAEAEYHRDRKRVIEKLADDTGCTYDDAERALESLEATHPKLKED